MGIKLVTLLSVLLLAPAAQAVERVIDLTPRPGAVLRLLADQPAAAAKGTVILLAGGNGILDLSPEGKIGGLGGNQLIRSRQAYVAAGYAYLAPDIASDLKGQNGYRYKPEFASDMALVVAEARKLGLPVHAVGTSRGAVSVAALFNATRPERPDSAVITSGMLISQKIPAADTLGPSQIRVPVLLLHHRDDACAVTPPSDGPRYKALLINAPRVDIEVISGGAAPKGDPCEAAHYHGFWGMDGDVVKAITTWLDGIKP
ncbi:hypothetical protein V6B08_03210 [Ferrovibrio sp. MS7]|uniref:alpha/beta hydrolase n=1 Tax=Ferrovibrio plantarum TaxID=3119164 RepID=UPI00313505C5